MYKRETVESDTDRMQKYDEDLNTTLIFVRFCVVFCHRHTVLTTLSGRSVLRSQLYLRHRRSIEAPARLHRAIRSIPPSNPPQP